MRYLQHQLKSSLACVVAAKAVDILLGRFQRALQFSVSCTNGILLCISTFPPLLLCSAPGDRIMRSAFATFSIAQYLLICSVSFIPAIHSWKLPVCLVPERVDSE
jgi:hypothetical protein